VTTATAIEVRDLQPEDWPEVAAIYNAGITGGNATFETEVPTWEAWDALHVQRLVADLDGRVVGWAAVAAVSERCCYSGVGEVSVYVSPDAQGQGVGRALLDRLIADSERAGIWTLQAGIFPENEASVALHRRCGFRVVGLREKVGKRDGVWRDVVLLERRSEIVQ
jgi:phosphinothricin acetyltransferase